MAKPTAAPARWPYTEHRTMAEVMGEEREREYAAVMLRGAIADDEASLLIEAHMLETD